ncbi:Serine/threonine protein kinase [Chondrus crispus]|uniref:Serine/threonine protein kinase n=1 Tax=Chondrus crispus TaxID=2769 RepID=R7QQQ8_CHOCR|nr:Serine/threonine protein kinase [Chondrus crispus]CDF39821.1 Serine/threonine protein kinase [Chondrus crispus]|eukprot:XP_005710115.1 Serine/threonine protein kinase [Chondrus crispus]
MAEAAAKAPSDRQALFADEKLRNSLHAALGHRCPSLLRVCAMLLARLSVDAHLAAHLIHPPFSSIAEAALKSMPRSRSGSETLSYRDAWRLSARAMRNVAAFAESNATILARDSDVVRLLALCLRDSVHRKPGEEAVECAAALANFARWGITFQAYIRKHNGLSALSEAAQQSDDLACKFHACRALAEFSLDHKWLMLLIAEGCIAIMLRIIEMSNDEEILSEATRFLGNIATSRIGREAINSANGTEKMVARVLTTCARIKTQKAALLSIDLLRTTSNLCVGSKEASQALINRGGVMAFIDAYGDDESKNPQQVKTEAFRGLLIIAQGGHGFRASVLREIGIKIRQDTCQGRCTAHLYDLGRRIKVEASTERKDDFPQTIAGLGARSKEYLFQAGPLAMEDAQIPNSVPDMKSPAAGAFRQSGRLLSVKRPVPHRERLERERKGRPPRIPVLSTQVAGRSTNGVQRRPRTEKIPAAPTSDPSENRLVQSARCSPIAGRGVPQGPYDFHNVADIPRCKVIDSTGKEQGGDGNWVLAVWSAVCNAVTRPPNEMVGGSVSSSSDGISVLSSEDGADVYEMGVPLGRGGFATVYLAKNMRNGELVAVKRFHPLNSATPDAAKKAELAARRAIKEQRIWDGLYHKNIVSYRGCFFGENGELNLVAEYIPGWSLADHISQISQFPEHMVACITQQIVDGLDYLHKCGVTHRDVKPANILVNPDGVIKITDFGVSSAVDVPTMTGNALVGTPWYIAPEMIEGRPYDKSVDIWSLGCTVLELATGRRPYHNMRPHVALFKMTQARMPPIPKKLSPVLRDFLKTCWVWDPTERPTPAHLRRHPFLASVVRPEITSLKNMTRET